MFVPSNNCYRHHVQAYGKSNKSHAGKPYKENLFREFICLYSLATFVLDIQILYTVQCVKQCNFV